MPLLTLFFLLLLLCHKGITILCRDVCYTSADKWVKTIVEIFKIVLTTSREDKDVVKMLSMRERGWNEGVVEGELLGAEKVIELLKSGLSLDDALNMIKEQNALARASSED